MSRPTYIEINTHALRYNVQRVRAKCPDRWIIAMVKANAYGCGLARVVPVLDECVDAFGVSCIEEACVVREYTQRACVVFEGVFAASEWRQIDAYGLECVIHQRAQLEWLLATPLSKPVRVWVKVNTGMNRLGFLPEAAVAAVSQLVSCPWVDSEIGVMTHLASADTPLDEQNSQQLNAFSALPTVGSLRSVANSAAILSGLGVQYPVIRPGIMLYGVSPFEDKLGGLFDLKPVMRFFSSIIAIQDCPPGAKVGYSGTWKSTTHSRIGVVAVGYGDGYPRHMTSHTPTWINGSIAEVVGRVSMDMLTVNLINCPTAAVGDVVELWGENLPIERIARAAGTSAYELMCQVTSRARGVFTV